MNMWSSNSWSGWCTYVLSVLAGSYSMAQLSRLLEQLDPRAQVFSLNGWKENSPDSLKDFAPLYYGFMNEFHSPVYVSRCLTKIPCRPLISGIITRTS